MPQAYQHIETQLHSGVLVIILKEKELRDNHLAIAAASEMTRAVQESEATDVVLDLEKLTILTSAALLPILGLRGVVKQQSGELILCNLSDLVAQALTVSQLIVERRNLKAHLKYSDDRASAIAMLQSKS